MGVMLFETATRTTELSSRGAHEKTPVTRDRASSNSQRLPTLES
jgi:hypothetical protein